MSKRKLLLADDSITIQKVVNLTFADEGIEVISVGDGDSAMEKFNEWRPDLVMADVNMPGLSGYEICQIIKQNDDTRRIPVILLVGSFEPFDEEEAARVGANDFLTKPFQSIRQLVNKVTELLAAGDAETTDSADETAPREFDEQALSDDQAPRRDTFADTLEMKSGQSEVAEFGDAGMDDEMIETSRAGDFGSQASSYYQSDYQSEENEDYAKTQQLSADDLKELDFSASYDDAGQRDEADEAERSEPTDELSDEAETETITGEERAFEEPSPEEDYSAGGGAAEEREEREEREEWEETGKAEEPEEREEWEAEAEKTETAQQWEEDRAAEEETAAVEEEETISVPESRYVSDYEEDYRTGESESRMPEREFDESETAEVEEEVEETTALRDESETDQLETDERQTDELDREYLAETEAAVTDEPESEYRAETETSFAIVEPESEEPEETEESFADEEEREESLTEDVETADARESEESSVEEETEDSTTEIAPDIAFDDGDLLELPPLVEETGIRPQGQTVQAASAEPETVAETEETEAAPVVQTAPAQSFPPELIEAIAQRVAEKLSGQAIKEIAAQLVPQVTDLIAQEMAKEKQEE